MTVFFSRLPHGGTKKDNLWTGYLETTYCLEKIAKFYSQIHQYLWRCYLFNFRTGSLETTYCREKIANFTFKCTDIFGKAVFLSCSSDLCALNFYRRSSSSINQIVYIDFHVCGYFNQNMLHFGSFHFEFEQTRFDFDVLCPYQPALTFKREANQHIILLPMQTLSVDDQICQNISKLRNACIEPEYFMLLNTLKISNNQPALTFERPAHHVITSKYFKA